MSVDEAGHDGVPAGSDGKTNPERTTMPTTTTPRSVPHFVTVFGPNSRLTRRMVGMGDIGFVGTGITTAL
jgi:hypothetical protein